MNKQKFAKVSALSVFALFVGGFIYLVGIGELGNLGSNMLANGGCSPYFLEQNKEMYTKNKSQIALIQTQIDDIMGKINDISSKIRNENTKINEYSSAITDLQKKISESTDSQAIAGFQNDIQNRQNNIKTARLKIKEYNANIRTFRTSITGLKSSIRNEQKSISSYETCKNNLAEWPYTGTGVMSGEVYVGFMSGETTLPEENGILIGNTQVTAGEMYLYTLKVGATARKSITVNNLQFKTTVTKTDNIVDGKIYDSFFIRSESDKAVCACKSSSEIYGTYTIECSLDECSKKIKKNTTETYTLFAREWGIRSIGSMTTRFVDMSYNSDREGINNLTFPRKFALPLTNVSGPDIDICMIAPDLCGSNHWVLGAWSACQNNNQSRTVECHDSQGTKINNSGCSNPQPVSSQSCTNTTSNINSIANFIVTAPTEVYTNESFDVTVKAVGSDNTKLSNYTGTVYFDSINHAPTDMILPSTNGDGYKFTNTDKGEHTFTKGFTIKQPGTYIIETYEIESTANNGNGVFAQTTIVAKDKPSSDNNTANTFTGFTLSLPSTITVNTPVDLGITAIKTGNTKDTNYNKSVIILIDGDPQATFPLTLQTLSNGFLNLPKSVTFKSVGEKTIIIKDVTTGIEGKKIITVSAENTGTDTQNEGNNQDDDNFFLSPIYTALLDNTTGLVYSQDTNIMKLDIAANNKYDILLKTIPVNMRIYTKKLNLSNIKLRDKSGNILNVTMTAVNKVNEFDKDVQLVITFNTPYAIPAGTGTSFSMTGTVTGESNEYDTVATWLGDKKKFTGVNVTLQKPFTGEDIPGYSWNAISLMRR